MASDLQNGALWQNVWSALQRLVILVIFAAAHWAVNHVLKWVTQPDMQQAFVFVEKILTVDFLGLYVYLGYEMLTVFIPCLRRRG